MTADVIDLTLSPEPILIESDSEDNKRPASPKPRKRARKHSKVDSGGAKRDAVTGKESPMSSQPENTRRKGTDRGEPPLKSPRTDIPVDSLFFIDVKPIVLQPALKPSQPSPAKPSDATSKLLLPPHVALEGSQTEPTDVRLEDAEESFIEYLDYDDSRKSGVTRYFEEPEEEASQPVKRVCRNCGGNHSSSSCKVLVCLICGARDEHPSRQCPISKTCFRCGRKGHVISNCPNRDDRSTNDCERCGSGIHKTSDCPTLWRMYTYVSDESRQEILQVRASKYDLEIGEGGEGYIGTDIWCYNCGDDGHWGDDCDLPRPTHHPPEEPSAFGEHNTLSGPFSDQTFEPSPSRPRRVQDWANPDYVDPKLPGKVGREGRRKDKAKMEQRARDAEQQDEDDWFNRGSSRKRSNGGQSKPKSSDDKKREYRRSGGSNGNQGKQPRFKLGPISQDLGGKPDSGRQSLLDRIQMDDSNSRSGPRTSKSEGRGQGSSKNRYERDRGRDRDRGKERDRHGDRDDKFRDDQPDRRPPSGPRYKGGYSR